MKSNQPDAVFRGGKYRASLPQNKARVWFCEGFLPWFGEECRAGCKAICAGQSVATAKMIGALAAPSAPMKREI